jgi:MioC protein
MSYMPGRSPLRISVLYGSQSGNAALVAEAVADKLSRAGYIARVLPANGPKDEDLKEVDILFVCTSSHGHGELPDNLSPTYQRWMAEKPDLSRLSYAVICLGDMTYRDTFCGAGATMDTALHRLGARRLKPRLEIDVSAQPFAEETALQWIEDWISGAQLWQLP